MAKSNWNAAWTTDNVATAIDKMGVSGKRTQGIDEEAAKQAKRNAEEAIKIQKLKVDLYLDDEAKKWGELEKYEADYKAEHDTWNEDLLKSDAQRLDDAMAAEDKYIEDMKKADADAAKDSVKLAGDRASAYRAMYKDMKGAGALYYSAQLIALDEQAKKYAELKISQEAIDAWRADQGVQAWIDYAKSSDDFFDGVTAGFLEMQRAQTTWGKVGYDAVKTFTADASSAISTYWFDELTGKNKESEENFRATAQQQTKDVMAESGKTIKAIIDAEKQKNADIDALYKAGTISFTEAAKEKAQVNVDALVAIKAENEKAVKAVDAINTTMNDNINKLGFDWDELWRGMLKSVTDNVALMIVQWGLWKAAVYGAQLLGLSTGVGTVAGGVIDALRPAGSTAPPASGGGGSAVGTGLSVISAGRTAYSAYGYLAGLSGAAGTGAAAAGATGAYTFGAGVGAFAVDASLALGATGTAVAAGGAAAGGAAGTAGTTVGAGAAGAGPVGAAIALPLIAMALGGAWSDYPYVSHANEYTPEAYANLLAQNIKLEDAFRAFQGGNNYEALTSANMRDLWKSAYN